jgi:hypothetical protein
MADEPSVPGRMKKTIQNYGTPEPVPELFIPDI